MLPGKGTRRRSGPGHPAVHRVRAAPNNILRRFLLERSRHFISRRMAGLAALCFAASTVAFAQSTYGSINGSVTDPSAATIRGAEVEATNQQTQVKHSLVTNSDGRYRFMNLDPGVY